MVNLIQKPLKLGDISLDKYVTCPNRLDKKRKQEIKNLIGDLEKKAMNVEELPLTLLKIELAQYPTIDTCFLTMSNSLKLGVDFPIQYKGRYKGKSILVPKFGIYKKTDEGFDDFSIHIDLWKKMSFKIWSKNFIIDQARFLIKEDSPNTLLLDQLVRSLDFAKHSEFERIGDEDDDFGGYYIFDKIPSQIAEIYNEALGGELSLITSFHGIIPKQTKQKIKKSKPIFDEELYLIAEVKPENWRAERITKDPLIIGVLEDKCYLIDHFDTTPIEHYVKSEFTQ